MLWYFLNVSDARFSEKLAPDLANALSHVADAGALVDIVVEFDTEPVDWVKNGNRALAIDQQRARFATLAEPVTHLIVSSGGEVLGEAWINGTLRARVPIDRLVDLLRDESVAFVDVPHRLERD